jgi:cytoskeletal protein CcmA (bactofilin family)
MIFGKKSADGTAPSGSSAVAEKSMEERRQAIAPPAPVGPRNLGEDPRSLAPPRSPRPSAFDEKSSTLSSHLSFDGTLKFSGKVVIDCEFRGSVTSDDTLIVGPSGRLEAELSSGVVEVAGKVKGNIRAKTRVKILSGGEVRGNIETPTISMDEGVVFEGSCTRPQESPGASQAAQPVQPSRIVHGPRKVLSTIVTELPPSTI